MNIKYEIDTPPERIKAFCVPEIKAIDTRNGVVEHLISTVTPDRAGDIVDPAGADLANFAKNPVVLVDHNYETGSVVGTAEEIRLTKDGVMAKTRFSKATQKAREVWEQVKEGTIRAWSIGFRPKAYDVIRDDDDKKSVKGFHFKEWELLEYSVVAIPMNPDAVTHALKSGAINEQFARRLMAACEADPKPSRSDAPSEAKAEGRSKHPEAVGALASELATFMRRQNIAHAIRGGADGVKKHV